MRLDLFNLFNVVAASVDLELSRASCRV